MSRVLRRIGLLGFALAFSYLSGAQAWGETITFHDTLLRDGLRITRGTYSPSATTLNILRPTYHIEPSHAVPAGETVTDVAPGIWFEYKGNAGGNGSNLFATDGGNGGGALDLALNFTADPWVIHTPDDYTWIPYQRGKIMTRGPESCGIGVESVAGDGGCGGDLPISIFYGKAGDGGRGGAAGDVNVSVITRFSQANTWMNPNSWIETSGQNAHGILALSQGGQGGRGGDGRVLGVAIGGDGGSGGLGGTVTVDAIISIKTTGQAAHAILAQSLGGAAGGAGGAGGLWGGGGDSGNSGHGGTIDLTSLGFIETWALDSDGILAQSIGGFAKGGGGGGGAIFYGGNAGSSGNGNRVTVSNAGSIDIHGAGGSAFVAQSIGGGGGRAGKGGGISYVGAAGGAGGNGGPVILTNTGRLRAYQDDSLGIFAQSIGGGGGSGDGGGGAVVVGGSGGSSGNGGVVALNNSATITTVGVNADAILAQSIGGGGGRAAASGGGIVFGGTGDSGGDGGAVSVMHDGGIQTRGMGAGGIIAQSIGGGGGRGGGVYAAMPIISFASGGSGSGGGDGAAVSIHSGLSTGATLTSLGDFAHGIHGESIGGGGGGGGNAVAWTAGIGINMAMVNGGAGGGGGHGGTVEIDSQSHVSTQGTRAHGIFAESIGGGGGTGGVSIVKSITVGIPDFQSVAGMYSIGGAGGGGGDGNAVTTRGSGHIVTAGQGSYGILAQSIGGGGGGGGYSTSESITYDTLSFGGVIGGLGGDGGDGGAVNVNFGGEILTQSDHAYGLLAQSVGGGGGAGGSSIRHSFSLPGVKDIIGSVILPTMDMELTVGGFGGGGGSGGGVEVINQAAISTAGAGAHGILAQSIGGGGGAGGDACALGLSFTPSAADLLAATGMIDFGGSSTLGGLNFAAGDGAAVSVGNHSTIVTHGDFAQGLFAQSIGGGGGSIGLSIDDPYGLLIPNDEPIELKLNSNGHGSGALVTVDNAGDITTYGAYSHGILAQSVGGGGGFAAINERTGRAHHAQFDYILGALFQGIDYGAAFIGSSGGLGSASDVNVSHRGVIETFGASAHGVFAQSAAARGTAGSITISIEGSIRCEGLDSHGVFTQRAGSQQLGGGDVLITINSAAAVRGGSGTGAGVVIDSKKTGLVINHGLISALSGTAIIAGLGHDTVINHGTVTGNVHLGAGVNEFINERTGRFHSGDRIDLGQDGSLVNVGVLSPGGPGAIASTVLIGNLLLMEDGLFEIDIAGLQPGSCDVFEVSGTAAGDAPFVPIELAFNMMDCFDENLIAAYQSVSIPFLHADFGTEAVQWMLGPISGAPEHFAFDILAGSDGWVDLKITNTVPTPGCLSLLIMGSTVLLKRRPRIKLDQPRASCKGC